MIFYSNCSNSLSSATNKLLFPWTQDSKWKVTTILTTIAHYHYSIWSECGLFVFSLLKDVHIESEVGNKEKQGYYYTGNLHSFSRTQCTNINTLFSANSSQKCWQSWKIYRRSIEKFDRWGIRIPKLFFRRVWLNYQSKTKRFLSKKFLFLFFISYKSIKRKAYCCVYICNVPWWSKCLYCSIL